FFYTPDVFDGLRRQILRRTRAFGGFLPAIERFVNGLHRRLITHARRQIVDHFAAELVAGADFDFVETVKHIELGQSDAIDAGHRHRLAHQHRIEPAATARAASIGADLAADFAKLLADLVIEFGGKWAGADAGGVRLHQAQHV